VTDRRRLCGRHADWPAARACLLRQFEHAIAAGIDVLQIRERDLEASALVELVAAAVALANGTNSRVVVNDRIDVALAGGAAGVHLRGDSIAPSAVRTMTPPDFLIGRSVHGLDEAQAIADVVDYIIAGTVWPTFSKPADASVIGPTGLRDIVRAVAVPVLAIGGVEAARVGDVAETGAAGVAAIGLFMGDHSSEGCRASPLTAVIESARRAFDTAKPPFLR
jgi:thiamine-phosphate diphosphorylase